MFAAIIMGMVINSMAYSENTNVIDMMPTNNEVEIIERWMDEKDFDNIEVDDFDRLDDGFEFHAIADGRSFYVNYEVDFELFGFTIIDGFTTSEGRLIK